MTTEHLALIRRLIESFIEYPKDLRIDISNRAGTSYVLMQCHATDHSKMVGKSGSHFHALHLLISELGQQAGTTYKLCRYNEPQVGQREPRTEQHIATTYDTTPACAMLTAIFAELCAGQYAVVPEQLPSAPDSRLNYCLNVIIRDQSDYTNLTRYASPTEQIPTTAEAPMTIIGAIGTLFRAYANRAGIRFAVQLKLP